MCILFWRQQRPPQTELLCDQICNAERKGQGQWGGWTRRGRVSETTASLDKRWRLKLEPGNQEELVDQKWLQMFHPAYTVFWNHHLWIGRFHIRITLMSKLFWKMRRSDNLILWHPPSLLPNLNDGSSGMQRKGYIWEMFWRLKKQDLAAALDLELRVRKETFPQAAGDRGPCFKTGITRICGRIGNEGGGFNEFGQEYPCEAC